MGKLAVATKTIFARWGCWFYPVLDREQEALVLGISVGLGALFNESEVAERRWMRRRHPKLRREPLILVLEGHADDVLKQVEKEQGLQD